ncbi:LysR substrate-binding domain-containing protein [Azohydromonas caseinilytica]|uniref:LysR family transcriptional regulator n=1 Tax=Azohydromonas caseinilytica TaxID=2728836 RepID=A0A848F9Y9_9BURK|nr:LysR substrate-binding domain-containing protein [Azohydromonas caseinilytica]NML16068.1 LysR family transcriptional regulator [Azohydromonas caseinilytica]
MASPIRLPPLHLLRTFEVAARHLSFTKAAQELHVTPAAVSQQIKALEEALGVALFQRLTRALRLSDAGAALLPGVSEAFGCLAAAVERVRAPVAATLELAAPPSFASHWLVPRLDDFCERHPGIALRLSSSPDAVDRRGEAAALEALRAHADDAAAHGAILYGSGDYPGWRVDTLFTPHFLPVCAPALAASLREPSDLCRATLIHDETLAGVGGPLGFGWPQWLQAAGVRGPAGARQRRFSNAVLAIEAALAGQGVTLVARELVAPQLAAGKLVAPFALSIPSPFAYRLVTAERSAARPAVAALREWLLAQAREGQADKA